MFRTTLSQFLEFKPILLVYFRYKTFWLIKLIFGLNITFNTDHKEIYLDRMSCKERPEKMNSIPVFKTNEFSEKND